MTQEKKENIVIPRAVTAGCYSLFIVGIAQLIYSFTGVMAPYGRFYSAFQAVFIIVMFAAVTGILSMERWGLWLFLALLAAKLTIDVSVGAFHPALLLWLLPAVVFLWYYRKMK